MRNNNEMLSAGSLDTEGVIRIEVPTDTDMRNLGYNLARLILGGDVIVLSGPLGAGKTTLAQGFGKGLGIDKPIVSPTFTIARELNGSFADRSPAHLIHVDAYRLGSEGYEPGDGIRNRLLDELESLGLDEELESPGQSSVVLMEWGEQMAQELAPERLEIHIDRPSGMEMDGSSQSGDELCSEGTREVLIRGVGSAWTDRMHGLREALKS
ncbi:tRNA (adenosine(37)-N6)-threonylcarbamoyltransferase complex ATPase subunit type 1 TsaE [Bifidobacterium aquikefiri]|uniref:tRNA (adenosine(37)-N6)-threonylcarbamoyltransferase complex ATPase subunit type 1 TsaE n=1 Tax=Bifidobacterium aquikefiri TaxID=1653207 RepID=UPI0039EC33B5